MTWSCPFFNKAADKGLRALESAGRGLHAEVTLRPYWSFGFHFWALTTVISHVLRAVNNLLSIVTNTLTVPFLIFTPWNIPYIPIVLVEHLAASVVSLLTAVVTPIAFVFRTFFSIILGYQEGECCFTWGSSWQEQKNYWDDATTIFIP